MNLRVWVWLLSLSVLWGGSFFFAKVALIDLGPLTVVFGRVDLAAVALNIVPAFTPATLFRRATPWASHFVMGTLNNLALFSLIFWSQTQITSGLASILNATTPLFALVVTPLDAAAGQVTASTMLILPIMLAVDRPWLLPAWPSSTTLAALTGLAFLSTALVYVTYCISVSSRPPAPRICCSSPS